MLTEEQRKLVTDNHGLIYYCVPSYDRDELYDVAAIGLCKAAATYDRSISRFSTYAIRCITNELKLYHKRTQTSKRIPTDQIYSYDATLEEGLTYLDVISDKFDLEEDVIARMHIRSVVESLDRKQRDIVCYLSLGYKQQEVADMVGCSQGQVSKVIKKVKETLLTCS